MGLVQMVWAIEDDWMRAGNDLDELEENPGVQGTGTSRLERSEDEPRCERPTLGDIQRAVAFQYVAIVACLPGMIHLAFGIVHTDSPIPY